MNTSLKIQTALPLLTEIVVDSDPEFADLNNPQGFIYDFAFLVQAETPSGRRFNHEHVFKTEPEAEAFAKKVGERGVIRPEHWSETYPVYGSAAWEGEEIERRTLLQDALTRNDQDAIDSLA